MLITFDESGAIEFTRKPELLALFPDDAKRIERMTDILFNEDYQRYYVWFKTGPAVVRERALNILLPMYNDFEMEYGGFETPFKIHTEAGGLITFDTYEDSVKAEIRFVEMLRDLGYSMRA
jgi:hypothetical protein